MKTETTFDGEQLHFTCQYDGGDAYRHRYPRQDAIWALYCVTVDFNSFRPGGGGSPFTSSGFGAESDGGSVTLQSRVNTDEDEILF